MGKTNDEKKWIIYMYTFPNGKRYIGKTCKSLKERQGGRRWTGYKGCPIVWKAIQKYGIENIQQDILFEDYMTDQYANRLEAICILLFKVNCHKFKNPRYGYNCDDGGGGVSGFHLSEEAKKKISEANKNRPPISEETRERMRRAQLGKNVGEKNPNYGKHASDELRKKMSESQKRKYREEGYVNPNKGKHLSEEQKQRLREINIGRKASEETKQKMSESHKGKPPTIYKNVFCEELNLVFFSMKIASDYTKADYSGIYKCCNGKQQRAGGYHWHYATKEEIVQYKIIDKIEVI